MSVAHAARWSHSSFDQWVPGVNLPAIGRGGSQRNSLNAAGLQLFGNCVTNVGRLSPSLLEQVYRALTEYHRHGRVDAVTVVTSYDGGAAIALKPTGFVSL